MDADSQIFSAWEGRVAGQAKKQIVTHIKDSSGAEFDAFWCDGSKFDPTHYTNPIQTEATYMDLPGSPIASASGKFGDGKVKILGFHPEIPYTDFMSNTETDLSKTNRIAFLHRLFEGLDIPKKSV